MLFRSDRVTERERQGDREREGDREGERERERGRERKRETECECVSVKEREREREDARGRGREDIRRNNVKGKQISKDCKLSTMTKTNNFKDISYFLCFCQSILSEFDIFISCSISVFLLFLYVCLKKNQFVGNYQFFNKIVFLNIFW